MNTSRAASVTYYVVIGIGYLWAAVQLVVGEPFDAFVLYVVTIAFQSYRNAVRDRY